MNILNTKLFAVVVMACLALPTISMAGENCPHNMGGKMGNGMMGGGIMNREAAHEALHAELKLTADQEGPWKTLTDTMMSAHSMSDDASPDMDTLTTPQRADRMLALSKKRAQNMETHINAMKAFYAVLTPAQQKIFDDFHADRRAMMKKRMAEKGMSGMGKHEMPMNE